MVWFFFDMPLPGVVTEHAEFERADQRAANMILIDVYVWIQVWSLGNEARVCAKYVNEI